MKPLLIAATVCGVVFGCAAAALACSCGGPVSAGMSFRAADLVFTGKVERIEPDGTVSLSVTRLFAGRSDRQVTLRSAKTDCDPPFQMGEAWMVYARERGGAFTTDNCIGTKSLVRATEDLKFLEGLAASRPQGIVFGNVNHAVLSDAGTLVLRAPFELLTVVADGVSQRFQASTDQFGPFQIVLPPGDFFVSVERNGRRVSEPIVVHVQNGTERQVNLAARF